MIDTMAEDITQIKESQARMESKMDAVCEKLDGIQSRIDYQRDFMHINRDKITWNRNKIYLAIGASMLAVTVMLPIVMKMWV